MSSTATIEFLASNLALVSDKLDAINRKAKKNGIAPITYEVVSMVDREEPRFHSSDPWYNSKDLVTRKYATIEYTTATVMIEGYAPVATLDFAHDTPTVFTWPGESYKLGKVEDPNCDHCKKSRRRNRIFVLRSTKNKKETIRVGASCIKDFLGYNPESLLETLKFLMSIVKLGDDMSNDDMEMDRSPKSKRRNDLPGFMVIVSAVMTKYGWRSSKDALANGGDSTSSRSGDVFFERKTNTRLDPKYVTTVTPTKDDVEMANKVIEYVANLNRNDKYNSNEYTNNLITIAKDGFFTNREIGFAASMINFYNNAMEREAARKVRLEAKAQEEANKPASNFIGNVGERITVEATLKTCKTLDSNFGITYLTKWVADSGDVLTWFATAYVDSNDINEKFKLVGTVKKHNDYNGKNETVLTRCKFSLV